MLALIIVLLVPVAVIALGIIAIKDNMRRNKTTLGQEIVRELTHEPAPQTIPPIKNATLPRGTSPVRVYIYDGRPLEAIPNREYFMLDFEHCDISMQSIYTDSVMKRSHVLLYRNQPVGFVGDWAYTAELLRITYDRLNGRISVPAKKLGRAKGGWPEVELRLPDISELREIP